MSNTVEGGEGSTSYCAPAAQKCDAPQTGYRWSEQDLQSLARFTLRNRISGSTLPDGVYRSRFRTLYDPDAESFAATVDYTRKWSERLNSGIALAEGISEGDSGNDSRPTMIVRVREGIHANGTISLTYTQLSDEEVSRSQTIL